MPGSGLVPVCRRCHEPLTDPEDSYCRVCGQSVWPKPIPVARNDLDAPSRGARTPTSSYGSTKRWVPARAWMAILGLGTACLVITSWVVFGQAEAQCRLLAARATELLLATREVSSLQSTESDLKSQVADLKQQLAHPTLGIWNTAQQVSGPSGYSVGGVPDTFTYHLVATSNAPMDVEILTTDEFAVGVICANYRAPADNCFTHVNGLGWNGVTSVNWDFLDSEGCAGYLVVFTAPGPVTVRPNISVTYNPAPMATGVCANGH